jgi:hypothetical protein
MYIIVGVNITRIGVQIDLDNEALAIYLEG